jgi:putative oxidoreductase
MHFVYGQKMADMVPKYIPGGVFWIYLTGLAMIAAGVSLLAQKFERLAGILLAVMLLIFIFTIHLPMLGNASTQQMATMGLLKDLALAGGALAFAHNAK